MTTAIDQRQALSEFARQLGWERRERERVDVYLRGRYHVNVMWRGTDAINGGAHYEDSILLAYTRELAKIHAWLSK